MKRLITCILLLLLYGCASTVPLPSQINIYTPSPEVSPKLAAFSGAWIGKWDSILDTVLVVESINSNSVVVGFGLGGGGSYAIVPQDYYEKINAKVLSDSSIGWRVANGNDFVFNMDESLNKVTGTFKDYAYGSKVVVNLKRLNKDDIPEVNIRYNDNSPDEAPKKLLEAPRKLR